MFKLFSTEKQFWILETVRDLYFFFAALYSPPFDAVAHSVIIYLFINLSKANAIQIIIHMDINYIRACIQLRNIKNYRKLYK